MTNKPLTKMETFGIVVLVILFILLCMMLKIGWYWLVAKVCL